MRTIKILSRFWKYRDGKKYSDTCNDAPVIPYVTLGINGMCDNCVC